MTDIPFSQALRERTWTSHGNSEGASFMSDLMQGSGTREDYIALVAQHYFVYEALESAEKAVADDSVASAFITPALTRLPAIEADLEFLLGADWREQIRPVPATERYMERINQVAADAWGGGFVAHHYTRYMGDLSGGQHIHRAMQSHFGFDTGGVSFYVFDQIDSPKEFKEDYRQKLDAVQWDAEERERVIEEVLTAYRLNSEIFTDLTAAKATA